ncbi:MAG: sulfatase [Gemmatimonadota bacterium]|nr:sulfatase [Gemmatimonadota bacterium]
MKERFGNARTVLAILLLLGIATGFVEALVLWIKHEVFGQVVFVSRHVLWMAPVAYLLVFGALGLVLAVGAFLLPRLVRSPLAAFAGVAFGVGCLLLPVGQISRIAAAILAAGVGVQAARFARERPARAGRALAVGVLVLGVAAALAGAVGAVRFRTASSGFEGPVAARGGRAPNVLLVVWDTVRSASLSLYGHTRPTTPVLERLAAESTVFDEAYSTSPWTLPGHSSLFTGYFPHEVSSSWYERLDARRTTLAEVFRTMGHATGGFVANHHYTAHDSGLGRGFETYRDYVVSWDQVLRSSAFTQTPSGERMIRARSLPELWRAARAFNWWVAQKRDSDRKHSDELNAEFLDWVDSLEGRPFFGFLNYFDAHAGYWSPPEFRERFPADWEGEYEAAIAYQDDRLGRLLDGLEERGLLENTVVIVTSDHGELFGEHGLHGHASSLYRNVLHVPLLIRYPAGVPAGRRVATPVSLRDVPATVTDVAGLDFEPAFPGRSLARYWTADPAAPETLLAEVEEGRNNPPTDPISRGPVRSVLGGGWQFILNGDDTEELYRFAPDSTGELDRATEPEALPHLTRLRTELGTFLPALRR